MSSKETPPSGLYLLWPRFKRDLLKARIPVGYTLRTYRESDERGFLDLIGCEGESMTEKEWHHYRDMLLPNGLFVVEVTGSEDLVATAGAVHNPNPGRYYFPFGGELGYLIVALAHRRRGLGAMVCTSVIRRLLSAGYEDIRVCVQEHRLPALHLYLQLGFEPFLHSLEVEKRWRRVCELLTLPFKPELWPRHL
jgi:mycothiol synthase